MIFHILLSTYPKDLKLRVNREEILEAHMVKTGSSQDRGILVVLKNGSIELVEGRGKSRKIGEIEEPSNMTLKLFRASGQVFFSGKQELILLNLFPNSQLI